MSSLFEFKKRQIVFTRPFMKQKNPPQNFLKKIRGVQAEIKGIVDKRDCAGIEYLSS